MTMFEKPYEREAKETLNILIYGRPGIGKTTLACSAPGAFLMDFDRGIDRVDPQYQAGNIFEPQRWEDLRPAMAEISQTPECRTIVIDTIGKLLDMAVDYIRRVKPTLIQNDGTPSLKGYGYRNQLFKEFLAAVNSADRSVVFVSHETEDKQKINREEISTMRPNITGSNRNEIIQDLDLMGYMSVVNGVRTITFDQNENILAKNSRGIHGVWNDTMRQYMPIEVPELRDGMSNDFLASVVFRGNADYLRIRKESISEYEDVMAVVEEMIWQCSDADTINETVTKLGGDFQHVFDSKLRAGRLLNARAKELNLKYNKDTQRYE